jgi:long-subunit acyl-CoA synthetase (AMP-forming)
MLTNRPEFHELDVAALQLGAATTSVYNTSAPEQILHVLRDAGSRVLVTERALLDRVLAVRRAAQLTISACTSARPDAF